MSSSAQHYIARSPRYILRPDDQSLLRFAEMETQGIVFRANIRDLSESGLCFALASTIENAPQEGDILKLEFKIPGRKQIACFATVVRVEFKNDWDPEWGSRGFTVVALQFRNLPSVHRRSLNLGLRYRAEDSLSLNENIRKRGQHLAMMGLTLSLTAVFYWITLAPAQWLKFFTHFF